MIPTLAMIVDAYRELNARKLFWITMGLSVLFALALGCIGVSERGFTILWFEFPAQLFNSTFISKAAFYRWVFNGIGFGFWLSWAAAIIAIISTASIVPDFVSSGSIELSLSKPVSRVRLFLLKYIAGLLFVAFQVLAFTVLAFLIVGIRGGEWSWSFFWAVPITVLFFSYLYCVSALVGVVTRSAITAILVTGLVWLLTFFVHSAESTLMQLRLQFDLAGQIHETELETRRTQIAELESRIAEADAKKPANKGEDALPPPGAAPESESKQSPLGEQVAGGESGTKATAEAAVKGKPQEGDAKPETATKQDPPEPASPWATMSELFKKSLPKAAEASMKDALEKQRGELAEREKRAKEAAATAADLRFYHRISYLVKFAFPKTSETMSLLEHKLVSLDERDSITQATTGGGRRGPRSIPVGGVQISLRTLELEKEKALRSRSTAWVLGTSIAFEALVLGATCVIFVRRDF